MTNPEPKRKGKGKGKGKSTTSVCSAKTKEKGKIVQIGVSELHVVQYTVVLYASCIILFPILYYCCQQKALMK